MDTSGDVDIASEIEDLTLEEEQALKELLNKKIKASAARKAIQEKTKLDRAADEHAPEDQLEEMARTSKKKAVPAEDEGERVKIRNLRESDDILKWLKHFEREASVRGWSTSMWVKHACSYLSEDILQWVDDSAVDECSDWAVFRGRMIRRYSNRQPKTSVYLQLAKMRIMRGERIKAYAARINKLARVSDEPFSIRELATLFLQSLPDKYHDLVNHIKKDTTLDELADRCANTEVLSISGAQSAAQSPLAIKKDDVKGGNESGDMIHCDKCGRNNHTTEQHKSRLELIAERSGRPTPSSQPQGGQPQPSITAGRGGRLVRDGTGKWQREPNGERRCYECGSRDHLVADCPKKKMSAMLMSMIKRGDDKGVEHVLEEMQVMMSKGQTTNANQRQ